MNELNYINQISNNLENKNGIWFSKSEALVSFPEEGYDSCYKIEEDSFWFRHRNNCIIEVAKNIFNTDDYIFDVGGGTVLSLLLYKKKDSKLFWLSQADREQ